VKIVILPKAIYRVKAIPFKIPIMVFTEIQKNPKIHMETQNMQSWPKKSNAGDITIFDFKLYYRVTVTKTA
jgi:hypothetical protein